MMSLSPSAQKFRASQRLRTLATLIAVLGALSGCGGEPAPRSAPPPEPPEGWPGAAATPSEAEPKETDEGPASAASTPPLALAIKPAAAPPAPDKLPRLAILAPRPNEVIAPDKVESFTVKLDIKDWDIRPDGPHLHLTLDNQPYKPIYDPKGTLKLGDISPGTPLAPGQHVLVVFPSRETHVSVKPDKGKSPHAVAVFWIGKAGKGGFAPADPMLIYSRPKGTYNGPAANEILLDFYLANVELGEKKHSVRATVTPPVGEAATIDITTWAPFSIVNLPSGETGVKLELLDKDGKVVFGGWTSTEHRIAVNRDAR
jgi:hypothetical protein